MTLSDPASIMIWLEKIDADLSTQRHKISSAASAFFRKKRDFELELAKAYVAAEGSNQKERESNALIHVHSLPVYVAFTTAEAQYHALTKVIGVLETRATICQSLLKIHAKEAQY